MGPGPAPPPLRRPQPRGGRPFADGSACLAGIIGAVSVSPAAHRLGSYFSTRPGGSFTAESVAATLRDLLEHPRGEVVVVWGGGGGHQGPAIRDVPRRSGRLTSERLPAYAPDPNPVEAVRSGLKYGQRASDVPAGIRRAMSRPASPGRPARSSNGRRG